MEVRHDELNGSNCVTNIEERLATGQRIGLRDVRELIAQVRRLRDEQRRDRYVVQAARHNQERLAQVIDEYNALIASLQATGLAVSGQFLGGEAGIAWRYSWNDGPPSAAYESSRAAYDAALHERLGASDG